MFLATAGKLIQARYSYFWVYVANANTHPWQWERPGEYFLQAGFKEAKRDEVLKKKTEANYVFYRLEVGVYGCEKARCRFLKMIVARI